MSAADDFAAFMSGHLGGKTPASPPRKRWQTIDVADNGNAGERTPADEFSDFMRAQLGGGDISEPTDGGELSGADAERARVLAEVIERHGVDPSDAGLLDGIPTDRLDSAASQLAARIADADTSRTPDNPADEFADFLNRQLNGEPEPEPEPVSREEALTAALAENPHLSADDLDSFLSGVPDDRIAEVAARIEAQILARNPDAPLQPRTPKPDLSVGRRNQGNPWGSDRTGLEGFKDALQAAVIRSDGEGAWQEVR